MTVTTLYLFVLITSYLRQNSSMKPYWKTSFRHYIAEFICTLPYTFSTYKRHTQSISPAQQQHMVDECCQLHWVEYWYRTAYSDFPQVRHVSTRNRTVRSSIFKILVLEAELDRRTPTVSKESELGSILQNDSIVTSFRHDHRHIGKLYCCSSTVVGLGTIGRTARTRILQDLFEVQ